MLSRVGVPDPNRVVKAAAGDRLTVRRIRHGIDRSRMSPGGFVDALPCWHSRVEPFCLCCRWRSSDRPENTPRNRPNAYVPGGFVNAPLYWRSRSESFRRRCRWRTSDHSGNTPQTRPIRKAKHYPYVHGGFVYAPPCWRSRAESRDLSETRYLRRRRWRLSARPGEYATDQT